MGEATKEVSLGEAIDKFKVLRSGMYLNVRNEVAKRKKKKTIKCAESCAFCCYAKVIVTIADGAAIMKYLNDNSMWSNELAAKLKEADRQMAFRSHRGYLRSRRPCAFLENNEEFGKGTCGVYPARPIGCGLTFSFKKPENCAQPSGKNMIQALPGARHMLAHTRMEDTICAAFGLEDYAFTLPGAVLLAYCIANDLPDPGVSRVNVHKDWNKREPIAGLYDRLGSAWLVENSQGNVPTREDTAR